MSTDNSFRNLLHRVRTGDADAAAELVREYEPYIRRAVRLNLRDNRLRRVFDSMDICQSVLASFFTRAALGQYDLEQPDQLIKLLTSIARHKLTNQVHQQRAGRRDHRRLAAGSVEEEHIVPSEPSPSEQVAGQELLARFRQELSEEERWLADQRALERPWEEIAAERGGNPDALRMKLSRAVNRVAQQLGLDEDTDE